MNPTIILMIPIILIFIIIIVFVLKSYRRCPNDKILSIYGKGIFGTKCQHGGKAFVWPVIQGYKFIDLTPISFNIDLRDALSKSFVPVDVSAMFCIRCSTQERIMQNAAQWLADMRLADMTKLALKVILGQMRLVIATMDVDEMYYHRDRFMAAVVENVEQELAKFGLRVINFELKDIHDNSGCMDAIAKRRTVKVGEVGFDVNSLGAEEQRRLFRKLVSENRELLDDVDLPRKAGGNAVTPSLSGDVVGIVQKLKSRGMMASEIAEITGLDELEVMGVK